jgi:hypothetical protein
MRNFFGIDAKRQYFAYWPSDVIKDEVEKYFDEEKTDGSQEAFPYFTDYVFHWRLRYSERCITFG